MDAARMLAGSVAKALKVQTTVAITDKARAAVVAALHNVKRDAGKR